MIAIAHTTKLKTLILNYRIEQNFGGKKFWQNCDFETLAEKSLANPRLACIFIIYSVCTTALKSVNYEILYIASMRSIERSR